MQDENKYYYVSNKMMAQAIRFISGLSYIEIPHKRQEGRSVYSFKNNDLLQEVLHDLMELREKYQ